MLFDCNANGGCTEQCSSHLGYSLSVCRVLFVILWWCKLGIQERHPRLRTDLGLMFQILRILPHFVSSLLIRGPRQTFNLRARNTNVGALPLQRVGWGSPQPRRTLSVLKIRGFLCTLRECGWPMQRLKTLCVLCPHFVVRLLALWSSTLTGFCYWVAFLNWEPSQFLILGFCIVFQVTTSSWYCKYR